jgi:hypothetical protein
MSSAIFAAAKRVTGMVTARAIRSAPFRGSGTRAAAAVAATRAGETSFGMNSS